MAPVAWGSLLEHVRLNTRAFVFPFQQIPLIHVENASMTGARGLCAIETR